jgi:hypothetical protein
MRCKGQCLCHGASSHMIACMHALRGFPEGDHEDIVPRIGTNSPKSSSFRVPSNLLSRSTLSRQLSVSPFDRISISLSSMLISSSRFLVHFSRKSLDGSGAVGFDKYGVDSKRLGTACRHILRCSVSDKIAPRLHPISCQKDPFFLGHPLQGFSGLH